VIDFGVFKYLAQGSGPFVEGNQLAAPRSMVPLVGQLSPWPLSSTTPAVAQCPVALAKPSAAPLILHTTITTITDSSSDISLLSRSRRRSRRDGALIQRDIDNVVILSVTQEKGKGTVIITIVAMTSVTVAPFPDMVATGTGVNPLGEAPMTSFGNGTYTLTVADKHGLDSVTVRSSFGGSMILFL